MKKNFKKMIVVLCITLLSVFCCINISAYGMGGAYITNINGNIGFCYGWSTSGTIGHAETYTVNNYSTTDLITVRIDNCYNASSDPADWDFVADYITYNFSQSTTNYVTTSTNSGITPTYAHFRGTLDDYSSGDIYKTWN
jgi:hypothetical protein